MTELQGGKNVAEVAKDLKILIGPSTVAARPPPRDNKILLFLWA